MITTPPPAWSELDAAFSAYQLGPGRSHPAAWLLTQTAATAISRRTLLSSLGLQGGWHVLDVGTGFGAIPMEVAALAPVRVVGLDRDLAVLAGAEAIRQAADARGVFRPGASVIFEGGDALDLPYPTASFDAGLSRFLYEHLSDPGAAAAELARVVRPGGLACVIDVDDGLSISYPPPSAAFARLAAAFSEGQSAGGGDRHIGRKLAGLLDAAGFSILNVVVLPQAAYGPSLPEDVGRRLLMERFRLAGPELVGRSLISQADLDESLASLAAERVTGLCQIEGHVAVLARRRGLAGL